jgi:hypothetical protein
VSSPIVPLSAEIDTIRFDILHIGTVLRAPRQESIMRCARRRAAASDP